MGKVENGIAIPATGLESLLLDIEAPTATRAPGIFLVLISVRV
jgi:hypothetical protein